MPPQCGGFQMASWLEVGNGRSGLLGIWPSGSGLRLRCKPQPLLPSGRLTRTARGWMGGWGQRRSFLGVLHMPESPIGVQAGVGGRGATEDDWLWPPRLVDEWETQHGKAYIGSMTSFNISLFRTFVIG